MTTDTDDHAPTLYRNTAWTAPGDGTRNMVGCSCGWKPKTAPKTMAHLYVSFNRHRDQLGLPRNTRDAVYGDDYPQAHGKSANEYQEDGQPW